MWWKKYSANADKKLSVLDIGCGKGEFLQFVVDEGSIGTGIEPSKYNRNVAKRTGLNVFPNRAKLIRE
ncbi:MAG: methyltransferase domain-containing protein, partial [Burkholderiales bacterium]